MLGIERQDRGYARPSDCLEGDHGAVNRSGKSVVKDGIHFVFNIANHLHLHNRFEIHTTSINYKNIILLILRRFL